MVEQIQIEIALFENDTIPILRWSNNINYKKKTIYTIYSIIHYNTIILFIKIIYIVKKKLSSADCQISRSEQNESNSAYCYLVRTNHLSSMVHLLL